MKPLRIPACCFCAVFSLLGAPAVMVLLLLERLRGRRFHPPVPGKSVRIAYVLTELSGGRPGGAASHKAGFCKGLLACGHIPTVLVSQPVPGLDRVVKEYHVLSAPELPKGFPLTLSVLANNIVFARHAYRILKSSRPDVVCQRHNQMNYAGALLSRLLKVPFILEYNSPANWKAAAADRGNPLLGQISRFIERINLAAADRIMVVSDVLKQQLVQRGIPPVRVAVNPNGADAELFHPGIDPSLVRQHLQLDGKIVVGFAGHHNSNNTWHGTKYLAMAVRKVAESRKDVQFLFIGDQGVVDLVRPILEAEGTKPFATFATSIPHPEMPGYYSACDILVSPHVHMADGSTFFGSPVKIFEYMAMGKPIVASGVGQLAELLKDRANALLTKPGDVDGLAEAILTLAGDPELRQRLGVAARETCLSRCTWKHNAERFIQAYYEASQQGSPDRLGSGAEPSSAARCKTFVRQMGSKTRELRLNRWQQLGRDLRALPLPQAGKLLLRKASKSWRARQAASLARRQMAAIAADLRSVSSTGQVVHTVLDSEFTGLSGLPILPEQAKQVADLLHQQFPGWVARCLERANRICENRISLLGHEIHLEEPPAWHKDHLSGAAWPAQNSDRLRGLRMNHGSDIKFVWELSRFHHSVTLGRAFALTGDERFAGKFVSLFSDWRTANPPGIGPNWMCAMEVAIRAVNLLWAGALLVSSKAFNQVAREAFAKTLLVHGVFISHHLEYDERVVGHSLQPVNGNHYLSDLAGLLHISLAFPEYRHAEDWRDFATHELFREIRLQVDGEGVHAEYSPGYHRLVLEMTLSCMILLERQGISVPEDIRAKVLKMLDFVRHYRKPSGGVPLVRDIDNGRFCILGEDQLTNHDHALALGAIYFNRPDFYPGTLYEDCLWHLGARAYEWHKRHAVPTPSTPQEETVGQTDLVSERSAFNSHLSAEASAKEELSTDLGQRGNGQEGSVSNADFQSRSEFASAVTPRAFSALPTSRLFRQSGFALMRQNSHYLLAVCCPKGIDGYCGHTHNDFLSFELEAFGRTFLTDCGSYVYTQSPEWRNRFRSTASHNTVVVDGQEQNLFNSSQLFEIDSRVRPEVRHWISNDERDILDAAYTLTLPDGTDVTHERRFVFLKDQGLWLMRDCITGTGQHKIETRFHFAEGLELAPAGARAFRTLQTPGPNLFLVALGNVHLTASIESGWVSRVYATKTPIRVLRFQTTALLPYEQWFILAPTRGVASMESSSIPASDEILRKIVGDLETSAATDFAEEYNKVSTLGTSASRARRGISLAV